MTARSYNAGFSLVEVIVAILILGIAVAGLTEGITNALSSSKESELQTTAALLAQGRIETLRAEGDYTDGDTGGDFGSEFSLYKWKQTIKGTEFEGLHDVTVTIEQAANGQTLFELRTLLFETPQESLQNEPTQRHDRRSGSNSNRRRR
ncbi:MAG TPA: prepilin-type N-terminal cleavage/methylation domain-containing protein [Verrucomicrobiae bacterium]|nr:prepilin-type N-terminal cleavage/methylation domain-containing protein [Verrucomicrobiae bacterium]